MNKVLLISYRFPPQGGGGVQRTLKYVKFLRDHGFEPVVQTASGAVWPVQDASLLQEIPAGVRIHHTPTLEPERIEAALSGLFRPLASLLRGSKKKAAPKGSSSSILSSATPRATPTRRAKAAAPKRPHPLRRLRDRLYGRLFIPDQQVTWVPLAVAHGLRIARREGIDIVYTSSPPNSVHFVGGRIAKRLGLPWVADFRDPWTDGPRRRRSYVGNLRRQRKEMAQEEWVLRNADRIVVSAPALRERFLEKYRFLRPEMLHVLTNGFDRADLAASAEEQSGLEPGLFHITGTGNIEAMIDLKPFLEAVAEACAEHEGLGRALRLNLVGAKRGQWDAEIARLGLGERIRYSGWTPHVRALKFLMDSQVLLMCQLVEEGGGGEKLSGKFFEYLATGKPILALTVPGLTATILKETGVGLVHAPADKEGIKQSLLRAFTEQSATRTNDAEVVSRFDAREPAAPESQPGQTAHAEVVSRFDRRVLAARLAALFEEVLAERRGRVPTGTSGGGRRDPQPIGSNPAQESGRLPPIRSTIGTASSPESQP